MSGKIETAPFAPVNYENTLTDTVFHLTPAANVPSILNAGLQPNPERGQQESWRRLEQFMDDIRPDHIRELGISRRYGVFAYTDIENLKPKYVAVQDYERHTTPTERAKHDTAFAIDVDPTKVMVFDMGDLQGIQTRLMEDRFLGRSESGADTVEKGLRYWNNGLTLEDFRKYYESKHNDLLSESSLKEEYGDDTGLKYFYRTPEVIVPGPIVGENVRWAASKIVLKDFEQEI
jgi:hypothetical protein